MQFTDWKILTVVSLLGLSVGCDGLNKETPPLPALPDTVGDVATDAAADTAPDTTADVEVDGSGSVPAFQLGRMVDVSGATFSMGSPDLVGGQREIGRDQDEAQHEVTVANFAIMPYEVTQLQWRASSGNQNPSSHAACDNCRWSWWTGMRRLPSPTGCLEGRGCRSATASPAIVRALRSGAMAMPSAGV